MFEEIIEKYTIETVSERTKISQKNLQRLRNGDFDGITRTQAYGFLRILQREFGEDFDDLRQRLDEYFAHQKSENHEPIFQRNHAEPSRGSKGWVVSLILGMALVFGGYLYFKDFHENRETAEPQPVVSTGGTAQAQSDTKRTVEANVSTEQSEGAEEANLTIQNGETIEKSGTPGDVNETVQKPAEPAPKKPLPPLEPVELIPTKKIWIGVIDLDTKKRTAKVTSRPYEIPSRGRRLVVTGHGKFRIADIEGSLFKYNDAKKHYLLIEDGRVEEIDKAAFKRLNGGKVW